MKRRLFLKTVCALLAVVLLTMCGCYTNSEPSKFYWIPEESYFVDYEIKGDRVIFSYSICFVNDYENDYEYDDIWLDGFAFRFKKSELRGWFERDDKDDPFITATTVIGEWGEGFHIKGGEKKNVLFYVEGKYLGGEVNENLSFPWQMLYCMRFVE